MIPAPASTSPAPPGRVVVVANPACGRHDPSALDRLVAALRAAGVDAALAAPTSVTALEGLVRTTDADVIAVAGGDGTLHRAAAVLLGRPEPRPRLAVVPQGTADVLAHEYALPRDPDAIAGAILAGRTRPLRFGRLVDANGTAHPFFLAASVGLDAEVVHAVEGGPRRRFKKLAYARAALARASAPAPTIRVVATAPDGARVEFDAALAIVAKARHYAGAHVLTRSTSMSEPGLRLLALRRADPLALLAAVTRLALGRLEASANVVSLPVRTVRLAADPPAAVQIDGEPAGRTPVEIEAIDAVIEVVVG